MKTILVIGDSWGVPNYPYHHEENLCGPNSHTTFRLKDLGYNVLNYSINGVSMIETIDFARAGITNKLNPNDPTGDYGLGCEFGRKILNNMPGTLDGPKYCLPEYRGEKIDWIVWFHTESIRSLIYNHAMPWITLEEMHKLGCTASYRAFANFVSLCKNPKTVVIGGQAPVDPMLYDYHKPTHVIEDWRSEIVGRKLPWCHTLSKLDVLDSLYNPIEEKLHILNVHHELYDAMTNGVDFYDYCHPGRRPHAELTQRLHNWFSNS